MIIINNPESSRTCNVQVNEVSVLSTHLDSLFNIIKRR